MASFFIHAAAAAVGDYEMLIQAAKGLQNHLANESPG
jgi:hypothetical protein